MPSKRVHADLPELRDDGSPPFHDLNKPIETAMAIIGEWFPHQTDSDREQWELDVEDCAGQIVEDVYRAGLLAVTEQDLSELPAYLGASVSPVLPEDELEVLQKDQEDRLMVIPLEQFQFVYDAFERLMSPTASNEELIDSIAMVEAMKSENAIWAVLKEIKQRNRAE